MGEELDVSPEAETTTLYEAIRSRRFLRSDPVIKRLDEKMTPTHAQVSPSSLPSVASSPASSLPTQTTPFVGRQQELAEALRRLHDPGCRLLTLVGPGGIGKTLLAIEAVQVIREFRFLSRLRTVLR